MSESASKSPPNASTDVHVSEPYNGDVVIGGISCRLPESDNMAEFRDNLMNGVDMVTEDNRRWEPGRCCLRIVSSWTYFNLKYLVIWEYRVIHKKNCTPTYFQPWN